jgi:hypothetical protein
MGFFESLLKNYFLIPFYLSIITGTFLIFLSNFLCMLRTRIWIRPFFYDLFNQREKKICLLGIILVVVGFGGLIIIVRYIGSYALINGKWVFHK